MASTNTKSNRTTGRGSGKSRPQVRRAGVSRGVSKRAQIVWGSLVASMTVVGSVLFVLDRAPLAGTDGVALTPLMATTGPDTVEAIFNTRSPLDNDRWTSIVIHDSGSAMGSPASLDAQARSMNLRGLGYHFVIGNGNGIDDGELFVGARWLQQAAGAHAAGAQGDYYNRHSVGICLIGDGNRNRFTPAQMRRLVQVIDALRAELNIPADKVFLHSQLANTASPGRLFPEAELRRYLSSGQ